MAVIDLERGPYVARALATQEQPEEFFHFVFNQQIEGNYYEIIGGEEEAVREDGSIVYQGIRVARYIGDEDWVMYIVDVFCRRIEGDPGAGEQVIRYPKVFKEVVVDKKLSARIIFHGIQNENGDDDVIIYEDMPLEFPLDEEEE